MSLNVTRDITYANKNKRRAPEAAKNVKLLFRSVIILTYKLKVNIQRKLRNNTCIKCKNVNRER